MSERAHDGFEESKEKRKTEGEKGREGKRVKEIAIEREMYIKQLSVPELMSALGNTCRIHAPLLCAGRAPLRSSKVFFL